MKRRAPSLSKPIRSDARLCSWNDIALYLGRGRRTVQRWHSTLGLPVHKVSATVRSKVFAYKSEIDRWLEECAERNGSERPTIEERARNPRVVRAQSAAKRLMSMTSTQYDRVASICESVRRMVERQAHPQKASAEPAGNLSTGSRKR